ncbi:MAG: hypothetical protein EON59_05820 [Alphaproteobacteria bacterium]|nr:MAG: hypothetical protein EON59_05820 [Alphaproteobacteria bacterium]
MLRWQAAAEIVIALAGPLAECRYYKRSRSAAHIILGRNAESLLEPGCLDVDGDFERVRKSMEYASPPEPVVSFRRLLAVADEVVQANWSSIGLLAAELYRSGTIGEDDLEDFFARRPALSRELAPALFDPIL